MYAYLKLQRKRAIIARCEINLKENFMQELSKSGFLRRFTSTKFRQNLQNLVVVKTFLLVIFLSCSAIFTVQNIVLQCVLGLTRRVQIIF